VDTMDSNREVIAVALSRTAEANRQIRAAKEESSATVAMLRSLNEEAMDLRWQICQLQGGCRPCLRFLCERDHRSASRHRAPLRRTLECCPQRKLQSPGVELQLHCAVYATTVLCGRVGNGVS